jgi:methylated-DNA-[protein]-cysteine S-methyltransferase
MAQGFTLFDTALGPCGVVWGECGIVGVQLPEASVEKTRAELRRRFRDASETTPPNDIAATIANIAALLDGAKVDFAGAPLDLRALPAFNRRVYDVASRIPPGATMTYGEIAAALGEEPQVARDVGQALGENPIPLVIPCHRVLAANGKPGGYSAAGGVTTKLKLLTIEGAKTSNAPSLFETLPLASRPRQR